MSPTSTYTPPYQLTDTVLSLSTEIAATVKEITVRGNLSAQPQLHRANRIRSVHSSLAIEHNSLTLDQVTALLNGKRVLAPQQEVWEVQNAFRAYDLLPSLDPYSIDDLLKVHRVMMDGLVMGAGTFRNTGVGVYAGDQLIHAGTPAQYVPEAMQQLFSSKRRINDGSYARFKARAVALSAAGVRLQARQPAAGLFPDCAGGADRRILGRVSPVFPQGAKRRKADHHFHCGRYRNAERLCAEH